MCRRKRSSGGRRVGPTRTLHRAFTTEPEEKRCGAKNACTRGEARRREFPRPSFPRIDFRRLPTTTSVRFNSHAPGPRDDDDDDGSFSLPRGVSPAFDGSDFSLFRAVIRRKAASAHAYDVRVHCVFIKYMYV